MKKKMQFIFTIIIFYSCGNSPSSKEGFKQTINWTSEDYKQSISVVDGYIHINNKLVLNEYYENVTLFKYIDNFKSLKNDSIILMVVNKTGGYNNYDSLIVFKQINDFTIIKKQSIYICNAGSNGDSFGGFNFNDFDNDGKIEYGCNTIIDCDTCKYGKFYARTLVYEYNPTTYLFNEDTLLSKKCEYGLNGYLINDSIKIANLPSWDKKLDLRKIDKKIPKLIWQY